jgi:hypothetical protein
MMPKEMAQVGMSRNGRGRLGKERQKLCERIGYARAVGQRAVGGIFELDIQRGMASQVASSTAAKKFIIIFAATCMLCTRFCYSASGSMSKSGSISFNRMIDAIGSL